MPLTRWRRRFGTAIAGTVLFGFSAVLYLGQAEYRTAAGQLMMSAIFGLWLVAEVARRGRVLDAPALDVMQHGFMGADSASMGSAGPVQVTAVQPGWYPDQYDARFLRWWDGLQWTGHTQPVYRQ
ncbi:DUF2510 domain-containing protein [Nocardia sp. NPDC059240]|uniref:DUF2510 domain-containing protein n=1 Tax=Nocardia sp. NPDC059240 TaxID=3346786 RepID=UPI0036ADE499